MANNSLLNPDVVTRKALMILHQKLNFVGSINRQYDDSFGSSGASAKYGKIGPTLKIRKPNKFTTRTGANLAVQDVTESSEELTVSSLKGVDFEFSDVELTLSIDDFASRYLEPAMATLASTIESDAFNMYKDVYNQVADPGAAIAPSGNLINVLDGAKALTDNLAPVSQRCLNLNTQDNVSLVNELKGLFNDSAKISKQYREGMVANNFLGYQNIYQNTLLPRHTTGTDTSSYEVDGASQTGSTLAVKTGSGTFTKGDIITIAGVNRVHPETKVDTGVAQQFVVTAAYGGGGGDIAISPAIETSGATQNVSASPADSAVITKTGAASATHDISLGYHKDAFTFVTAPLEMPKGLDFSSRQSYDGISMRVVRDYDINTNTRPCRIDVLYGYKTIRPELAVRYGFN